MGYQLVAAALQPQWGGLLTATERLVLVVMCQSALDETGTEVPARCYWGGMDHLILAAKGHVPAPGSTEDKAARQTVRRALRSLETAGAIERTRDAANGLRAEYELKVWAPQLPVHSVDNSTEWPTQKPPRPT